MPVSVAGRELQTPEHLCRGDLLSHYGCPWLCNAAQTRLSTHGPLKGHHDIHGDPFVVPLDPEGRDLRAILDVHIDRSAGGRVRKLMRLSLMRKGGGGYAHGDHNEL